MKYNTLLLSMVSVTSLMVRAEITQQDFRLLISPDAIKERITKVAAQLDHDYHDKEITLVMVMKGAVCLVADLLREIQVPCTLEYISASSYGQNGTVAGTLTLRGLENVCLKGKHVIIVDDIFDTGCTMATIRQKLLCQEPASVKTFVLLLKNKPRTITELPDYALFEIEDEFVIGYGLDYKELYRGLPGIYVK